MPGVMLPERGARPGSQWAQLTQKQPPVYVGNLDTVTVPGNFANDWISKLNTIDPIWLWGGLALAVILVLSKKRH